MTQVKNSILLNSEPSIKDRLWSMDASNDEAYTSHFAKQYQLPLILAKILLSRSSKIADPENFINPKLSKLLPDPFSIIDMEKAVNRSFEAINKKQKICIYADYDVDGATASALLRNYFKCIDIPTELYIPDRITEGYGANSDALALLKNKGIDYVIMVDCGTTSFEPLELADKLGLDIVVIDHHTAENHLPKANAIVNPNRLDQAKLDTNDIHQLCAAGVVFMFLVAMNRKLRSMNYFNSDIPEPQLMDFLDLVALGTVCDVMPLTGLNRAFVKQGLKILNKKTNKGIDALCTEAGIQDPLTAYHLGFVIGPRINAGGRVGQANLGSQLLYQDCEYNHSILAHQLCAYNEHRQMVEKMVLDSAFEQIEKNNLSTQAGIIVYDHGWHPGVIGIIASRIKETYNKPSLVITFDEENQGKGSGRSISGIHLGEIMIDAVHHQHLLRGGGHAMAAGFSLEHSQLDRFITFFNSKCEQLSDQTKPTLFIDEIITLNHINYDFLDIIDTLEPYGNGNPQPRFMVENIRICTATPVGDGNHARLLVEDDMGHKKSIMAFKIKESKLDSLLHSYHNQIFDIVVMIKKNFYNGQKNISIVLEDISTK
ncbi:MAG: single-stranded-DNA-specific exonuclease RecJ [Candidatus Puniceispirillum sp.]|nr:single-stranded-DNA-specific exonuclease RecJ [Candidatus Pelagibacter sp.]MBA4283668.1 single-stranded-DNA-specific exonuclease RecJ [Candidatus Puniceispirillum sp.]